MRDELKVLKICDKESGTIEQISKILGWKIFKTKNILKKLEKENYIYEDDGIWASTLEGRQKLK